MRLKKHRAYNLALLILFTLFGPLLQRSLGTSARAFFQEKWFGKEEELIETVTVSWLLPAAKQHINPGTL